jgi:hypothetical protein
VILTPADSPRYRRLRVGNAVLAALHLGQALVILALANDFSLPVTGAFLDGPPGTAPQPQETLFDLPLGPAVAAFLILAAVDHALVAAPGVHRWYAGNLARGINVARWVEYSLSASLMVVLIAMLTGVADLGALIAVFGANAAMILFGWLMERTNIGRERTDWLPFWFGCVIGVVPWAVIVTQIAGSVADGGGPPGFVYGIFVTLLVLFSSFALNQWLQYRGRGRFRDYLFGEWGYLVLSLVAKSLLAWQVFANALVL